MANETLWYFPNLRTRREECKLTQNRLAELSKKHCPEGKGASKETISRMERHFGASKIKARIVFDAVAASHRKNLEADKELTNISSGGPSGQEA